MATLTGTDTPVLVDADVFITAPGLVGRADIEAATSSPVGRGEVPLNASEGFAQALENSGLAQRHAVAVTAAPAVFPGVTGTHGTGQTDVVLQVPDPGPNDGAVLLMSTEDGLLSWHFPDERDGSADRGGTAMRFRVPAARFEEAGAEPGAGDRSLFGVVGTKLLAVFVYPIARAATGYAAEKIAAVWEANARPSMVRRFTLPEARAPHAGPLNDALWRQLARGRALVFVHGTFSTSQGGFAALPDDALACLAAQYGDRVVAFDHPTLSVDAITNARAFLDAIPADVELDVDIVCHSRGGLVARVLAGELPEISDGRLRVGKIVFVGTPNMGTALADPQHMGAFLDRYTTLLNIAPPGPWSTVTDVIAAVLEVVKIVGQGALGGLPGLAAMNPTGTFLRELNASPQGPTTYYAIAANYEPTGSLLRLVRVADGVVDAVFDKAENDMVVPTAGVAAAGSDPGVPVARENTFMFSGAAGVWHCTYFGQPETALQLSEWLAG